MAQNPFEAKPIGEVIDEMAAMRTRAMAKRLEEDPYAGLSRVYTIYDVKADQYHQPFFAPTDAFAIRLTSNTVNDPGSNLYGNAEDYTLWRIGFWDDKECNLMHSVPDLLAKCHDLRKEE